MTEYNAFRVELADKIAHVQINRPDKINAMNQDFWREIIEIFRWVDDTDEVRVVVLSGAGKHFSSGIDLMLLAQVGSQLGKDVGRNADALRRKILELQASFNAVDNCRKPVLAAIRATAWAAPSTWSRPATCATRPPTRSSRSRRSTSAWPPTSAPCSACRGSSAMA